MPKNNISEFPDTKLERFSGLLMRNFSSGKNDSSLKNFVEMFGCLVGKRESKQPSILSIFLSLLLKKKKSGEKFYRYISKKAIVSI